MQQQQRTPSVLMQDPQRDDSSVVGRKEGQTRGNAHAAEWFATRDPLDRMDEAGNPLSEAGEIDMSCGGFDGPGDAEEPEAGAVDGWARLLATEAHPICALRPSGEDELVQLLPADVVAPGAQRVTRRYGSLAKPYGYADLVMDPLFIGGRPHVEDVQQGGIGSCYLLADLLSVASQDPAHIERMITVQGGTAVVTFHRYDEQARTWVPVAVAVNTLLARNTADGGSLLGSGFRVAKEPVAAEWYAEVNESGEEGELVISRHGFHEAAMWVPLIEKAYARYSEMYGQCGGHPEYTGNEKAGGSGFDAVEGGWASGTMRVLYGEGVVDRQLQVEGPDQPALLIQNRRQIAALLRASEDGARTLLGASANPLTLAKRLGDVLGCVAVPSEGVPPKLLDICQRTLVAAQDALAKQEAQSLRPLSRAFVDAVPAGAEGELGRARDICTVLMNVGITDQDERRSIYADHAYAVLGTSLRSSEGEVLDIRPTDLGLRIGEIDGLRSEVVLRNPHRTNEMDLEGDGPDDGVDDGLFRLPLERFLTMFTQLDIGTLQ